ncbi:lipoyl synthase [Sporomusa termitida]|uniref:Lipoyl synthase n=1 Tax=Sporomusa termitida TaxID=2377 RepID=A0A517DW66_9FIRM|nr:lipoyl synthase [Sporomusa termitida]QDR81604.1 Lipoyl synthase [Sporomusa termitida]
MANTAGRATDRPPWLTLPVPEEPALNRMKALLDQGRLHTVCESADCPNIGECFGNKTCTFMILGSHCTRNCRFCAVPHGSPAAVDPNEPQLLAATARQLGLQHVVITSVTRDDLADGGAGQFAAAIGAVRAQLPKAGIEVLIPDFKGSMPALEIVLQANPDILNHNIETVPRLYPVVRPQAGYSRSLALITRTSQAGILPKSGLMLGLGEKIAEAVAVMKDLHQCGCKMLTLGQYLSPSPAHLPVKEYIHPDVFTELAQTAQKIGFRQVNAGPLVRSSYHAGYSLAELIQA